MGSVSAAQPKHGRKRARGSDSGGARPSTRQRRLVAARAAPEAAQPAAESAEAAAAPPEAAPAAAPGAALEAAQQTAPVVPFREVPAAAGEEPSPKAAPPAPPMQPAGKVGAGATAGAASMAAEGSGAAAAAAVLTQRPAGPNTPAKSSEVPGEAVQQQLQQAAATATAATAAVVQQPRPDAAEGTGQEMPPLHLQQQQQQQQQQPIIPTAAPAAAPAAAPPAAALEDQLAAVLRSSGVGEEGIDAFRSNCHRSAGCPACTVCLACLLSCALVAAAVAAARLACEEIVGLKLRCPLHSHTAGPRGAQAGWPPSWPASCCLRAKRPQLPLLPRRRHRIPGWRGLRQRPRQPRSPLSWPERRRRPCDEEVQQPVRLRRGYRLRQELAACADINCLIPCKAALTCNDTRNASITPSLSSLTNLHPGFHHGSSTAGGGCPRCRVRSKEEQRQHSPPCCNTSTLICTGTSTRGCC